MNSSSTKSLPSFAAPPATMREVSEVEDLAVYLGVAVIEERRREWVRHISLRATVAMMSKAVTA
jgi:hypothetical protein